MRKDRNRTAVEFNSGETLDQVNFGVLQVQQRLAGVDVIVQPTTAGIAVLSGREGAFSLARSKAESGD